MSVEECCRDNITGLAFRSFRVFHNSADILLQVHLTFLSSDDIFVNSSTLDSDCPSLQRRVSNQETIMFLDIQFLDIYL